MLALDFLSVVFSHSMFDGTGQKFVEGMECFESQVGSSYCQSESTSTQGFSPLRHQEPLQRYICKSCQRLCNERTGTSLPYIHKPVEQAERMLKMRGEGMGVRAAVRVEGIAHGTVSLWEQRLAQKESEWSPPARERGDVTVDRDELYTRIGENRPASKESAGS